MIDEPCQHAGLQRRAFLGLAGASLAGPGLAAMLGAAPADAAGKPTDGPLRFAAISDTHVSLTSAQSTTWLTQVYAGIARRDPDFVLHCGDITDTGLPGEYENYAQTVPDALRDKIHYSPGNHETRWDPSAKELYRAHFGPAPYSFDTGGLHVIGFDPTQVLQEPGHSGPGGLQWLEADLRGVQPNTPVLLFQHFPLGNQFCYVDDQVSVLDTLSKYNFRGLFAGHIHREDVTGFNGFTQVALDAVLKGPTYYWAEKTVAADGVPVLNVTRVRVEADGTETETPLAVVPLDGDGQGRTLRPRYVHFGDVADGSLPVEVRTAPQVTPAQVAVRPYPQEVFGGTASTAWQPLAADRDRWSGAAAVPALAPGLQRLQVRVSGADGRWWEQVALFPAPGTLADPVNSWSHQLAGSVQGGIAPLDPARGSVVAASTAGQIVALLPDGKVLWQAEIGPVYRQPAVDSARRTVFLPSADHHLYALDGATGGLRWKFDAAAPVLSAPTVVEVNGQERVLFSAGQDLFCLDTGTGKLLWSVPGRGFSSGQAACDGQLVYTAAADGYARAHDVRTGEPRWAYQMASGDVHRVALYSGWDNVVALGGGVAIVATVSSAVALDAATGAPRWSFAGSSMYAPALFIGDATVLLTTEWGVMSLVELATGKAVWQTDLGARVFNAGVALDGGVAWAASVDGKLIGVRLSDGSRQGWLQHSLVYTFSRPAVMGRTLIVGDQDGTVHGIRLP